MKRRLWYFLASGAVVYLLIVGLLVFLLQENGSPPEALSLHAVFPAEGRVGEDLKVVLSGSGFDRNTRVSMALDLSRKGAILSTTYLGGSLTDIVLNSEVAFVAIAQRGLQSVDVRDRRNPRVLGTVKTPDTITRISIQGHLAFLCLRRAGVLVVDISDPEKMSVVGKCETGGTTQDICLRNGYAYVANGSLGLQVLDIRDPAHPRLIGSLKVPGVPLKLAVREPFAFIASSQGGLQIVDVRDPRQMTPVSSLHLPGPALSIALEEDIALIAVGGVEKQYGVFSVGIRDPHHALVLAQASTSGVPWSIALSSGVAYVGCLTGAVDRFDLSDPARLLPLGSFEAPGGIRGIDRSGQDVFVAASKGLTILDTRELPSRSPATGRLFFSMIYDSLTAGETLYIGASQGVHRVDMTNPSEPRVLQKSRSLKSAQRLALAPGALYAAHSDGLIEILDVNSSHGPFETRGTLKVDSVDALFATEGFLLVTDGDESILYGITDPFSPRELKRFQTGGRVTSVARKGDFLYLGNQKGGLQILDLSRPDHPRFLGQVSLPWHMQSFSGMSDLAVKDQTVIVADARNGLVLFDVADPVNPQILSSLQFPGVLTGITILGDRALVSDSDAGLHVVDIRDLEKPTVIATLGTGTKIRAVGLEGDRVLLFENEELNVLPLPVDISEIQFLDDKRIALTLPSPPTAGRYTLRVFNGPRSAQLHGVVSFSGPPDAEP